jgi:phage terminase large subunit-like protein
VSVLTAWEAAARLFEPPRPCPWDSPLDLACALDPRFVRTPALELINAALVWADETPDARLIVVMSPQEGKSLLVSNYGVLWSLIRDRRKRLAITSYGDALARRWGRSVRNLVRTHGAGATVDTGLRLAPDLQAANEWQLTTGGGVVTAGVHTGLTGRPVDHLVIDDPLKDRDEADSPTVRENVWEFWTGTAVPRLAPRAPVTLVMTRWHHDDLAGRLIAQHPGEWKVVHIPAQADPDIVDPDPLGRAPGEFMVSARGRTREDWERRKAEMGPDWMPLAQGAPAPPGGDAFDVSKLRYWHWTRDRTGIVCGTRTWRLGLDCWVFITMDTASSVRTSADWTVASVWAVPIDGTLALLDVQRRRVPAHQQIDVARPLVDRWRPTTVYVEPSMRSTQLAREAALAGWRFRDVVADKDKVRRAAPAARRVDHGEVWWPSSPTGIEADADLLDYIRLEVQQFPNSRHDDFVDTLSYAARCAFQDFVAPTDSSPAPGRTAADEVSTATDVPRGFDPARADW